MPAPLPLLKLGALLAKQIAKPLAKILKEKAKHSEFVRQRIVMPPAQC
jgi:optic atrophy 3 protein